MRNRQRSSFYYLLISFIALFMAANVASAGNTLSPDSQTSTANLGAMDNNSGLTMLVHVANNCTDIPTPCFTSFMSAIAALDVGGVLQLHTEMPAENIVVDKDMTITGVSAGAGINGSGDRAPGNVSGGSAAVTVTAGNVLIEKILINTVGATNAVSVQGGTLTLRGASIEGGGVPGIIQTGGTVTAYANNFENHNFEGVSGVVSAPKNWWGVHAPGSKPSGVSNADWDVRLGTNVIEAAFGDGEDVSLGEAGLTGGTGTGVIMNLGSGQLNVPFNIGIPPHDTDTCSDYYDFYSHDGSGWTVVLPVNTVDTGCVTNTLNERRAFAIDDITQCVADSPDCWDPIPLGQITIVADTLQISGMDLSGTHIVAGTNAGADPTNIQLQTADVGAWTQSSLLAAAAVLTLSLLTMTIFLFRQQAARLLRSRARQE